MKKVIVMGAAGEVGFAIVEEFLQAGFEVLAPTRRASELEKLRALLAPNLRERLAVYGCDLMLPQDRMSLGQRAKSFSADGVVASLGGWYQDGPLERMSLENWNKALQNNLTSHFLAAQTLLPQLRPNEKSFCVMIGGGAAFEHVPGAAHVSVAAAAQLMLIKSFKAEYQDRDIRFFNPVFMTPLVTRSRGRHSIQWITASLVGKMCVAFGETEAEVETVMPIHSLAMAQELVNAWEKQ